MGAPHNVIEPICIAPVTAKTPKSARWKRFGLVFLLAVLLLVIFIGGYAWYVMKSHNFHVVSAGQLYRSAQLDPESLARIVHENGIKSVINLRGGNWAADWYYAETNAAKQLGLTHVDIHLSASDELTNEQMESVLKTIESAPKPVLIHCKNGADRTGLFSALYLYAVDGKSAKIADGQLTMLRGHIPYLFFRDTIAMDHSFSRYVEAHGRTGKQ